MTAVIYARFSSHSQTEQSIEGQLKTCYDYAAANKITIVGEFIDRAQSGTNDNRTEFQRMIATSERHTFDTVLVYQLDRFARNRYDSAINKAKLKKNGVRVISARENIADDASGILVEGVLESMAEYYSAELSQKIRRGMDINGEKCLSTGSNPGLGFRVDDEKRIVLDPDTAPVVRTIFEQYVAGDTIKDITDRLISQGVQTSKGGLFNKNSLRKLLSNRRYLGIYIYKGKETPGAIPRIIDDDLFERAQARLEKSKKAPAQAKAKAEYLLTTKLFCGHCREMMTGYAGTSKTGTVYHYYICNGHKAKVCTKKNVRKEYIEALLVQKCREQLTDENIQIIAKEVAAVCAADYDTSMLKHLRTKLKEVEKGIENLLLALESGQAADIIAARISQRSAEKAELERQISIEMQGQIPIDEKEILFFLYSLQKGAADNDKYRKMLINIFLVAAYLYDDKLTYILTVGGETITVTKSLMDAIDESNAGFLSSFFNGTAPPQVANPNPAPLGAGFGFVLFLNNFGKGQTPKVYLIFLSGGSCCGFVFSLRGWV